MTAGPTNELPPVHEAWLPKEHSLFRPRHGRRQMTALVSALVFFATPALMWVFGMRASEIENHRLAAFPSIAEGWGLFTGLDDWATDNLPFRQGAVNAADWVSRTFFGEPAPFDQGGSGAPTGPLPGTPGEQQDEPAQTDDPSAGQPHESEQVGYRDVVEGEDGWLYYGRDAWSKCQPIMPLSETIGQLAKLRETVESSGRTFVLVVVPDKTTMVPEYLPDTYAGKDCADPVTPQLWQQAVSIAGALDMRPRLADAAERNDRPVYYPQDTHWTNEGALEMVKGVATEVRPGIAAKWVIDQKDRTTGSADLPRLMGKQGTTQITNYRLRPDGRYDRARKSTAQLEEAKHYEAKRLPGMLTQPTAVFGDSFLVAASAYLPAAFSDVTMQYYHSAQSRPTDVIKTFTDAEVVVLQVVERNVAAGAIPVADQGFMDALGKELAEHPVR